MKNRIRGSQGNIGYFGPKSQNRFLPSCESLRKKRQLESSRNRKIININIIKIFVVVLFSLGFILCFAGYKELGIIMIAIASIFVLADSFSSF